MKARTGVAPNINFFGVGDTVVVVDAGLTTKTISKRRNSYIWWKSLFPSYVSDSKSTIRGEANNTNNSETLGTYTGETLPETEDVNLKIINEKLQSDIKESNQKTEFHEQQSNEGNSELVPEIIEENTDN
eukprot:GHVR01017409.1.p1 GENE.GHVR01017409.1~~GHVR01017409.1.p1  ORF type:complete len:130 (+),score=29.21 GHVR01017409.1:206-595(+)